MYRILIAGCVLVVALAACTGGSRPPSRTTAPPSISLDGQVLDADSGQPISGVSVSAGNQETEDTSATQASVLTTPERGASALRTVALPR
jgi:hypothetical protein